MITKNQLFAGGVSRDAIATELVRLGALLHLIWNVKIRDPRQEVVPAQVEEFLREWGPLEPPRDPAGVVEGEPATAAHTCCCTQQPQACPIHRDLRRAAFPLRCRKSTRFEATFMRCLLPAGHAGPCDFGGQLR